MKILEGKWTIILVLTMLILFACRFAYIEFTDKESVDNAVSLDDSLFKGRQIKVQFLYLDLHLISTRYIQCTL